MIPRRLESRLLDLARQMPAVTVTGPRQSGKTTLCRSLFADLPYQNLELPDLRRFAEEDPRGFLASMPDGGVIDEAQRVPSLFSYLQADIDEHRAQRGRWILSGSHNFLLLEGITQSLAGRTAIAHLHPLELGEWRSASKIANTWPEQVVRGGFPALADDDVEPAIWMDSYLATYVERDVRQISGVGDLSRFRLFLELCAGRSGQEWNGVSLAGDVGVSRPTIERWLSILEASFVVFRVRPLHRNLRKRLVKRSRLHFADTGLLCNLIGIRTPEQLRTHPLRGAIFETWVIGELHRAAAHRGVRDPLAFYRDQRGSEVDAIVESDSALHLIEVKSGATYQSEMSHTARRLGEQLGETEPTTCNVVYGGTPSFSRGDVRVVAWNELDRTEWLGG